MCGIAGYHSIQRLGPLRPTPALETMVGLLVHRGPDDEGFLESPGTGLGMRRLSVIDLETGNQPISNETGQVHVVFNGEIYNYRELRSQLRDRGHSFSTASDTEVLVHGYEEWGADIVHHLRGMFAFAILDQRDPGAPELFLARDHCGIKPLYYAIVDGTLCFASEIKSLLAIDGVSREMDFHALDRYLAFLYVPEPSTIYSGISALSPGSTLFCSKGQIEINRYWTFESAPDAFRSRSEAVEQVRHGFEESVQAMLVADVPIGLFLSSGIDSVSILAMMSRQELGSIKTFTIGFGPEERQWNELREARAVADAFGAEHHEFNVEPDVVELLPAAVRQFDQPFANPTSIILALLARETRQHVKVALAGTGGDELFAGYPRYLGMLLHQRYAHLPASLRRLAGKVAERSLTAGASGSSMLQRARRFLAVGSHGFTEAYIRLVTTVDEQNRCALYTDRTHDRLEGADTAGFLRQLIESDGSAVDRLLAADILTYLPFNQLAYGDRMSMAHSLEVRVPFVDQRLLEVAARIPLRWNLHRGETKSLLREAMAPFLPDAVTRGRKRGLNLPIPIWFRGQLRGWMEDLLSPERLRQRGFFDPHTVGSLRREHQAGVRDHSLLLWAMVTLEIWCQHYLDR